MKEKNYLFRFIKYIKVAKLEFFLGFAFILIAIFTEIFAVKMITNVFSPDLQEIDKSIIFYVTLRIALFYLAIKLFEAFSIIVRKYLLTKGSNKLYYAIQRDVYNHVQALPIEYFDNMPAGSVLSRITSDVNHVKNFFKDTFINLIVTFFKIVIMYTIMFFIDYKLSLLFLMFTPVVLILQRLNTKVTYPYVNKSRAENSRCSGLANEIMQNLEVVKAFNNEENILDRWEGSAKEREHLGFKISKLMALTLFNAFELLRTTVQLSIIFYYTYSEFNGFNLISAANILIFIFYSTSILNEITLLTNNLNAYTMAKGAARNIYEILNLKVEMSSGSKKVENFKADITFKNVSFAYKEGQDVLKNVDLKIEENQSVAFVGHTGSGKTTIMNLIIKFYQNQKGTIFISGEDIKEIDNEFLRSKIAIVLQDSFLFEGTLLSNICEDEELAKKCLELVGAGYLLQERGIDALVMPDGSNFSTGEKQLICFARALAKDPKILILDEATANVDSKTEQVIQKGIEILMKGRTTLIIAHRLSTIKNVDNIFVLEKGVLKESGNHEELMQMGGIYSSLVNIDLKDVKAS